MSAAGTEAAACANVIGLTGGVRNSCTCAANRIKESSHLEQADPEDEVAPLTPVPADEMAAYSLVASLRPKRT
jgi:hypothetical protein